MAQTKADAQANTQADTQAEDKPDEQAAKSLADKVAAVKAPASTKPARRLSSDKVMHVKVYSPYQVYFDDEAESISAENDTGPFDILPRHHRFLTLLIPCELTLVSAQGRERIKISRGVMYVKEDQVTVFLDV